MFVRLAAVLVVTMVWVGHGKHIAVIGGIMKSHHLSVVPMIEALAMKGHRVSFLMPNTTEAKSYFPKGVANATMVYLGSQDWSFDTLLGDTDVDFKNQAWPKKLMTFATILSSYRTILEKPFFSMHEDLVEWLLHPGTDAVLVHVASFGAAPVVQASGIPYVSYIAIPPVPAMFVRDTDEVCRFPNLLSPPRVDELKSSLMARVVNHMQCRLLQGYLVVADHELGALFETKGVPVPKGGVLRSFSDVDNGIIFGGPPLSLQVPLGSGVHLVGSVEQAQPHTIPSEMLSWLDAARDAGASILYISLGTKYEFTQTTCFQLVTVLHQMIKKLGVRILWSLRASQQEKLATLLPSQQETILIETFTPQPEVLRHSGVKIFLSHCGWGGVTDSVFAGVPVLGYPGMAEQFVNARSLEQAGAGIMLNGDFSNLLESTQALLGDPKYAAASKAAGEALRSYGGLARAVEVVEAAAHGQYLTPDPTIHKMMADVDPFFKVPQPLEQWISFGVFSAMFLVMMLMPLCCCRYLCWCCCRARGRKPAAVELGKKSQ